MRSTKACEANALIRSCAKGRSQGTLASAIRVSRCQKRTSGLYGARED